jgi:hypothetical protein
MDKICLTLYKMSFKTLSTLHPIMCRYGPATDRNVQIDDAELQVMFSNVYEEANVNYNNTNGTFTAQVKGAYFFDLMLCAEQQSGVDNTRITFGFDIKKGAAAVQRRETYACGELPTSGQALQYGFKQIVTLGVGDTVRLRVYGNGGGAQIYRAVTSHYNVFLISAYT